MSAVKRHVLTLPGTHYTRREAARILGVTPDTLRYLIGRHDLRAPSKRTHMGKNAIYLYSPDDLEELRGFLGKTHIVESVDWTKDDAAWRRQERQRLHAKAYYHRKKRESAEEKGDFKEVARRDQVLADIRTKLDNL
jgi:DNA-binding transcriptional MerR regulator